MSGIWIISVFKSPLYNGRARIPNMFGLQMVVIFLDVEWLWFWMAFQNWTAQPFQIQPNSHHLGFLCTGSVFNWSELKFWMFCFQLVGTKVLAVAMVLIILIPNHPKSEHQIFQILNGFQNWMLVFEPPLYQFENIFFFDRFTVCGVCLCFDLRWKNIFVRTLLLLTIAGQCYLVPSVITGILSNLILYSWDLNNGHYTYWASEHQTNCWLFRSPFK